MKHVIIGNGPAGVIAAETLRKLDANADIVLAGDEPEPPYSRMAIPYLLMGNIAEPGTHLRKESDHYSRLKIRLVNSRAEKIDDAAKNVKLANGETLSYDRLLIATGSHPLHPPLPGMDLPGVHSCWTLADARQIIAKAKPGARVVQMGAGFIGCIIMEALAARGVKLSVVEMGDRMVPRMMNETAGGMIRRWVEKKGVRVHVSTRIEAITAANGANGELSAKLSTGDSLPAALIISATGVRPNIAFLQGTGINTKDGVLVDDRLQTSVPGIYAAGDVTEAIGFHSSLPELNAVQPNAADQARVAAANMAGRPSQFQGSLAINVLDTLGLISTSFGQWWGASKADGGESVELVDAANFRYLSLQLSEDVLIGATSIGWSDHVGALRGLIQGRVRLGPWRARLLADPTQFMAAYLGAAQGTA
ncbi:MAG: NAD(P)/FAD-dependent oxidoreductase [Rhodocyclaceae bacterium]|nr:MAG: NAD(P)/FAD-dependent oxidoreductase [Rhodocyclaceae bacterium]